MPFSFGGAFGVWLSCLWYVNVLLVIGTIIISTVAIVTVYCYLYQHMSEVGSQVDLRGWSIEKKQSSRNLSAP